MNLQFGLSSAVPKTATTAWGARLIFPADLLWDRQSFPGRDTESGQKLHAWLNKRGSQDGALQKALRQARLLAARFQIEPSDYEEVILYEDEVGMIVANPNSSFGYLYCAAWLKEEA